MTKQTIEVEGLPEGWEPVAYRCAVKGEYLFLSTEVVEATHDHFTPSVIVQKTKPRRIVLEETTEERSVGLGDWYENNDGVVGQWSDCGFGSRQYYKIWREVKESDSDLKLSLSRADCKAITGTTSGDLAARISRFIAENS